MSISYGAPACPNSLPTRVPYLKPEERCPRSDTYRAIESGDNHNIFGWMFRCRTCGSMFFRASRAAGMEGIKAGQIEKLKKGRV